MEDKMDRQNWFDGQWCKKCIWEEVSRIGRIRPCVNCIYAEDGPTEFVERTVRKDE